MRIPSFIRKLTDPILENIPMPITGGVNRGRLWNLASSGAGYGSGRRAADQMTLFSKLVRPGDVVWDVGAHHGYVTLCAAARVGSEGRVHAFEPSARNRRLLQRHVDWNKLGNVTVLPFALAATEGEARFGGTGTSKMLALGAGDEMVSMRTADSLVASGECRPPSFIKIDVEGAEAEVLKAGAALLGPETRLIIAMHHREADAACTALLTAAGFRLAPSRQLAAMRTTNWDGDPDLYCAGPAWPHWDEDLTLLREAGFTG